MKEQQPTNNNVTETQLPSEETKKKKIILVPVQIRSNY